jgi:hypothetical protein
MKLSHFALGRIALLCLTVFVLAKLATAGTPGKCTAPTSCSVTCGSPSAPCMVLVSEDNASNVATATMENLSSGTATPNQDICLQGGTEIIWHTEENESKFTATFGKQHPFKGTSQGTAAKFKGKKRQPASDSTNTPTLESECYVYNLRHCIGTNCKAADPKVIVKGGTGH